MAVKRPGRRRPAPVVGVAVAFLLLLTLATARPGDASLYPPAPADAVTVYLVDNGYHTDLALPRAALAGHRSGLAAGQASQRPWVLIGFGDARYFMDSGMSAGRALDGLGALLGMGHQAAIRFDGLPDAPDKVYAGGVRPIRISKAGLAQTILRIDRALSAAADGGPVQIMAPHEPQSAYFRSPERFSLAHLCNHWTGELLSAAGLPTTPVLDTTPATLKLDLDLRARP